MQALGLVRRTAAAVLVRGALAMLVFAAGYVAWLDLDVRRQFDGKRWQLPARLYARPLELYESMPLSGDELVRELEAAGYHRVESIERAASYEKKGDRFRIATRSFRFWDAQEPARRLTLEITNERVASLADDSGALPLARLDPALIGRIYPRHREDRVLVRSQDVPQPLTDALIAVEDREFYSHHGVSFRAIGRALLANLKAGAIVQGGSTLTQQLAKNFFLTNDRTVWRKLNDALIALMLEARYDKVEILEAYLNEVFLGQQGGRAIHGFGLAAQHYFGRRLDELELPEIALLVAVARGAPYYNPRRHPERAMKRRNLVLNVMQEAGLLAATEAQSASKAPLGVLATAPRGDSPYPAFVDLVRRQLRRDYHDDDLRSEGLRIFTTLAPSAQLNAEEALARRLARLEADHELPARSLQSAVTVTDVQSGEVLALIGARDPRQLGFNRAIDALRPIGSLIKPVVYLTALEQAQQYTLVSELDDVPVEVEGARGAVWSPSNYDGKVHGLVPLHAALSNSYNLATVNLGLRLGVAEVARGARRLGLERPLNPYPSLLLGAVELSPLEVTQMYQTIASGGFNTPLRAIREVTDSQGQPLARYGLSVVQAYAPGPVFLLTHAMQEVLRSGTGRSLLHRLPSHLGLAGKTGTTNGLRDSWFAGFSGQHLSVVWLGRDDNAPARLSGATGALQVWGDLIARLRPDPLRPVAPAIIEWHWTDARGRYRTDASCPGAQRFPFIAGSAPPYAQCVGARERRGVSNNDDT